MMAGPAPLVGSLRISRDPTVSALPPNVAYECPISRCHKRILKVLENLKAYDTGTTDTLSSESILPFGDFTVPL